jgi:hypothetical protein
MLQEGSPFKLQGHSPLDALAELPIARVLKLTARAER